MFRPKRTVEFVTKELIDGLDEGRIVLREEDLPPMAQFRTRLEKALASARGKERYYVVAETAALAMGLISVIVTTASEGSSSLLFLCLIAPLLLASFWLLYKALKSRESTTELKTYVRVLKMADDETAKRIAKRLEVSRSHGELLAR